MGIAVQTLPEPGLELERKALTWVDRAKALAVTSQASYDQACQELLAVKALRNEAEEHHRPLIKSAHETHRLTLAALAKIDEPLRMAESAYKQRIGGWDQEQQRIAREREREAAEVARRAAEGERLAEAQQAVTEGATEAEVDAIIEQPMIVTTPVVAQTFERAKGVSTVELYSAKVVDIVALCRAVVEGKASPNLISPNQTALNQMARAMKTTFNIPGVKLEVSTSVRAGGR